MVATYSSETSVDLQRTTRCYIPQDRIPQSKYDMYIYILGRNFKFLTLTAMGVKLGL
jgi:hypothetical protein